MSTTLKEASDYSSDLSLLPRRVKMDVALYCFPLPEGKFPKESILVGLLQMVRFFFYINIKYYNICYILLYFNYYATLQGRCQEEQKTMSTPWPAHKNTQQNQQLNKHLQNGTHTIRY